MWWNNASTQRIYGDMGGWIEMFRKIPGRHTRAPTSKYVFTLFADVIPEWCTPILVYRVQDIVYLTGEGELDSTPVPIIEDNTHWIIQNVQFPNNVKSEIESVRGVLRAVSDGSFKDAFGTAAWMIHVSDRCVLRGHCVTPGNPSNQSAYRSELTGIYGIVCTIWYLYNKYGLSGHITVGCDGLSALRHAQKTVDFVDPNIAQYNMIMAIRTVISQLSWQWDWIHVKGHQDDAKSQEELDQWSLWNIQMDAEAKQFWKMAKHQYIDPLQRGEP
jgi:hypothetical protein